MTELEPIDDQAGGLSRRSMLKRAGAAGVATVWTVPAIQTLAMPGAAAQASGLPGEGSATVSGVVVDAQTGAAIAGATVVVQGTALSAVTDSNGLYTIASVPAGAQTLIASATGYQSSSQNTTVPTSGAHTVNFALSAINGELRVVLSWGASPSDLDLHMSGPIPGSSDRFHVYYLNSAHSDYVALDRDDTDGQGPETTSIAISSGDGNTFVEGSYHVWIHNYSGDYLGDAEFDASGATVTLFGLSGQVGSPATPPSTGDPTKDIWNVLTFDVDNVGAVSNVVIIGTYQDGDQLTQL